MQGSESPASVQTLPFSRWKTCTAMTDAPRATPEKDGRSGSSANVSVGLLPRPAAMPATCVPCVQPEIEQFLAELLPVCSSWPLGQRPCAPVKKLPLEKHAWATTSSRNG